MGDSKLDRVSRPPPLKELLKREEEGVRQDRNGHLDVKCSDQRPTLATAPGAVLEVLLVRGVQPLVPQSLGKCDRGVRVHADLASHLLGEYHDGGRCLAWHQPPRWAHLFVIRTGHGSIEADRASQSAEPGARVGIKLGLPGTPSLRPPRGWLWHSSQQSREPRSKSVKIQEMRWKTARTGSRICPTAGPSKNCWRLNSQARTARRPFSVPSSERQGSSDNLSSRSASGRSAQWSRSRERRVSNSDRRSPSSAHELRGRSRHVALRAISEARTSFAELTVST